MTASRYATHDDTNHEPAKRCRAQRGRGALQLMLSMSNQAFTRVDSIARISGES